MHPNPVFHVHAATANLDWARARGFGMLAVSVDGAPLLSHVPFLLDESGAFVDLHLVGSNPIARVLKDGPQPARVAVTGPDGYISPDWYGLPDQVPTWNYVAVHLTGQIGLLPQEELRGMLDRQSAHFEAQLTPKVPWTSDKMTDGLMDRMMRAIRPCRMTVTAVDGTWKLNQNKTDAARQSAADHLEAHGVGADLAVLAAMMRGADGQA